MKHSEIHMYLFEGCVTDFPDSVSLYMCDVITIIMSVIIGTFFRSCRSSVKACPGVLKVLKNAAKQERVVNGVHKCAAILEKYVNVLSFQQKHEP